MAAFSRLVPCEDLAAVLIPHLGPVLDLAAPEPRNCDARDAYSGNACPVVLPEAVTAVTLVTPAEQQAAAATGAAGAGSGLSTVGAEQGGVRQYKAVPGVAGVWDSRTVPDPVMVREDQAGYWSLAETIYR